MSSESKSLKSKVRSASKKVLGRHGYNEVVRAKHFVDHKRAVRKAGYPARGMHVIGVTGTNGKTTTVTYLFEILKAAGYKVAMFSTTHYQIMDEKLKNETEAIATSEDIRPIIAFYKKCQEKGITHVIQETTSQALHQWRVMGIPFEAAIMTNLTYEHMDYHFTMKKYAAAKAMLFKKKGIKFQVLNRDDEWFGYFNKFPSTKRKLSYGTTDDASVRISDIAMTQRQTSFTVEVDHEVMHIKLNCVGSYNIHNAAAAIAMAHCYGVKPATIEKALSHVPKVDGRLEYIDCGQPFAVYGDYAHTPDGITQIGQALRAVTPGKTILVQSVYDGRDPKKWVLLGEEAGKNFDLCILADEEAYDLPRKAMRDAIKLGYKNVGYKNFLEIQDRQTAINEAIARAEPGDSVVIVPFGHITSRTFYGFTEHWDDREAAKAALAAAGYTKKSGK